MKWMCRGSNQNWREKQRERMRETETGFWVNFFSGNSKKTPTIIFGLILSGCCVVNTAMKTTDMCIFFFNKNALPSTQECNTTATEISLPGYKHQCYVLDTTTPLLLWHSKGALGSMQRGDKAASVPFLDGSAWNGQEKREWNKNHLSLLV